MTSYLTIADDDAKKLCGRLEFDASWDKAGTGYYELNKQMKPSLSISVGSFLAYNHSSIIAAMGARLIPEEEDRPIVDCAGAIQVRNELLSEVAIALENHETLVRLIASEPALIAGNVSCKKGEEPLSDILRKIVISNLKVPLNKVISNYFVESGIEFDPAAEYRKIVVGLIDNWQLTRMDQREGYQYKLSVQIKDKLSVGGSVLPTEQVRRFGFRENDELKRVAFAESILAIDPATKVQAG